MVLVVHLVKQFNSNNKVNSLKYEYLYGIIFTFISV